MKKNASEENTSLEITSNNHLECRDDIPILPKFSSFRRIKKKNGEIHLMESLRKALKGASLQALQSNLQTRINIILFWLTPDNPPLHIFSDWISMDEATWWNALRMI